jgi:hypothetical protein
MARMTKTSKENLLVADRIEIEKNRNYDDFAVVIFRGGKMAYLSDKQGPMTYKTIQEARRVVKRVRPDIEPTTI